MKVVLATTASGGHLFPALKVAEEFQKSGHEVIFLGTFRTGQGRIEKLGFPCENIETCGINSRSLKEYVRCAFTMTRAIAAAFKRLRKIKPDMVVGFGGYGAFPIVLTACFLRYPTLIHEQNVIPGRVNNLLARFVSKIAMSFRQSAQYFHSSKTILTGCPTHILKNGLDRRSVLQKFHLNEDRKTLFVFGGSQGSQRINEVFIQTAQSLKEKLSFQVIHVAGNKDNTHLKKTYDELQIPYALFDFLEDISCAYHVADLVIARAGAATVTEIAGFRVPAILIPYPYGGGHQKENARILAETKLARLIEEHNLSPNNLEQEILRALQEDSKEEIGEDALDDIYRSDSAQRVAQEALGLVK